MFTDYPFTDSITPVYNRLWEGPGDYLWFPAQQDAWRRGLFQEQEDVELGEAEEMDGTFITSYSKTYMVKFGDQTYNEFDEPMHDLLGNPIKHVEFDNMGLLVL